MLFDVMVNGIVSLISLSDHSLLIYRNARDFSVLFCIPQLYHSLMNFSSFLVASLGFSMHRPVVSDSVLQALG